MNEKVVLIVEDEPRAKDALYLAIGGSITAMGQSARSDIEADLLLDFYAALQGFIRQPLADLEVLLTLYFLMPYLQGKLSKSVLLEQLKCKNKIKALHKPILSIPQSLRPIESVAL